MLVLVESTSVIFNKQFDKPLPPLKDRNGDIVRSFLHVTATTFNNYYSRHRNRIALVIDDEPFQSRYRRHLSSTEGRNYYRDCLVARVEKSAARFAAANAAAAQNFALVGHITVERAIPPICIF